MANICVLALVLAGLGSHPDMTVILNAADTDHSRDWMIVNDTVMGGVSRSRITSTEDATIVFSGTVSLENNGGFASTRFRPESYPLMGFDGLELRIRGDGNTYQLRLRTDDGFDGVAYRARFPTRNGVWETLRIPFSECIPSFRGRMVTGAPALNPDRIRQIGFLIADKQAGAFRLEIDSVAAYR